MNQRFLKHFTEFIFVNDKLEEADVIMVPGNGWPQMAQKAAALYREGYAPLVLPSGRFGKLLGQFEGVQDQKQRYQKTYETEWEFLQDVLIKDGVPPEAIVKEDQATFTYENAIYSRKATDQLGLTVKKAIICCKAYHARRCQMYYQLLYPDTQFLMCGVDIGVNRQNWHQTTQGIELVLGEIERCGSQFYEILKSGCYVEK